MSKWISGCYADQAVEKAFLVAQPIQLVAHHKSSGILVGRCSDSGGHSERRKPAGKGAKGIPPEGPEGRSSQAPFGTRRCQNGVCP